jgi:hypothetical protein
MNRTFKTPIQKMSDDVIEKINGELLYISKLPEMGKADQYDYGVEGQLVTLQVYTQKALSAWVENAGPEPSLDILRKVAAIAIKALETYGCPARK